MLFNVVIIITIISSGYVLGNFIVDILLRGFAPFIPSRPWVVEATTNNLKLKKYNRAYALGSGRSGFIYEFEKMFPSSHITAVEHNRFTYLVAKTQILIRILVKQPSKIKVIRSTINRLNISDADFIYCHLYPEHMEGLGKKLKFECRPGIMVVSNGFLIPDLEPKQIVELPEKKAACDGCLVIRGYYLNQKEKKAKRIIKYFFMKSKNLII